MVDCGPIAAEYKIIEKGGLAIIELPMRQPRREAYWVKMICLSVLFFTPFLNERGYSSPYMNGKPVSQDKSSVEADALAARAREALRKGDYREGIASLKRLVKILPNDASAHADLCIADYFGKRFVAAANECRSALKLNPKLSNARYFLGISLAHSGNCKDALPYLSEGFSHAQDLQLRREIGTDTLKCSMALGRVEDEVKLGAEIEHDFPNDPEVLYLLSHLYSDLSTSASERLLEVAPGSSQAHRLYAEVLDIQGKPALAIREYRKALAITPDLVGVHYEIGKLLLKDPHTQERSEEAKREFEEELRVDPRSSKAQYELGVMALRDRDWDTAIANFQKAIGFDPQSVRSLIALGRALTYAGREQDAVTPLERAVKMAPHNPDARYLLSSVYRRVGRVQDAARELAAYKKEHDSIMQRARKMRRTMEGFPN